MKYNRIPKTDMDVSRICLGTMTFGEQNSEDEAHAQLDFAAEKGVNFLDTAELYAIPSTEQNNGLTEKYIGSWMAQGNNREKMYIGTKIAGRRDGKLEYIREECNFKPETIRSALEGSLKRLQTDYVDIYQLHWPQRKANFFSTHGYVHHEDDPWQDDFLEVIQTLNALVKEGKMRYWGLSNETPWGLMRTIQIADANALDRCITVQNPYNLLNRLYEVGMSEINMREDVRLLPYSPMAFGMLSGKYHSNPGQPEYRLSKFKTMARYSGPKCYDAVTAYLELATQHGLSLAQMSLAFIIQQPFVASTIIGATNLQQLEENISSDDLVLSQEVLYGIEKIHLQYTYPTA